MIVVLTMGRSGSSLLMQTLHELGVSVVGQAFRENPDADHIDGNPRGYFEDRDIMYGGPASATFQRLLKQPHSNVACKMDLKHFVSGSQTAVWHQAVHRMTTVFVSFREPTEQAYSEFQGYLKAGTQKQAELAFSIEFLKRYCHTFASAAQLLRGELRIYQNRIHLVDYAEAMDSATCYVERIAVAAKLTPTADQIQTAVSNIDSSLHRNRYSDFSDQQQSWAKKLNAHAVYNTLKRSNLADFTATSENSVQ